MNLSRFDFALLDESCADGHNSFVGLCDCTHVRAHDRNIDLSAIVGSDNFHMLSFGSYVAGDSMDAGETVHLGGRLRLCNDDGLSEFPQADTSPEASVAEPSVVVYF